MRLTNQHRQAILRRVIGDRFEKQLEQIEKSLTELADRVYVEKIGDQNHQLMERLPESYFTWEDYISLRFGEAYTSLKMSKQLPIPYDAHAGTFAVFNATHEFSETYRRLRNEKQQVKVAEREIRTQAQAVLGNVTTDNRLIEEWPEIEKIVREVAQPTVKLLPAVQMEKLNRELGLGKDQASTAT